MISATWLTDSVSLNTLRHEARYVEPWSYGVYRFLQFVGVVPDEQKTMPAAKVRLNIDPEKVPAGYLAACAYEWDAWGPSQPSDFISAMEAELVPQKRDLIAGILTSLGRAVTV